MKQIFFILFVSCLFSKTSYAQQGGLYLHSYHNPLSNIDYQNLAILQDQEGIMHFANTKGLISYDGIAWEITPTLSTPLALALDTLVSHRMLVGCKENFGYLEKLASGQRHYVSISDANRSFGAITHIVLNDQYAFFYSRKVLYRVALYNLKVEKVWIARPDQNYAGIFVYRNDVYLNIKGKGVHRIMADELVSVSALKALGSNDIVSYLTFSDEQVLIATNRNQLLLFDGRKAKPLVFQAEAYIQENLLVSTLNVSQQYLALATLSGGCILIDKKSGKTWQTINYQSGLPDDEVYALGLDHQGGLWIATDYSISRADLNLPIQNFAKYPGLDGKIISVNNMDGLLYVATTEGLFYLDEVRSPDELLAIIQEQEKITEVKTTIERTIETELESENQEKSLLKKIFRSKDPEKQTRREEKKEKRETRKNDRRKKQGKEPPYPTPAPEENEAEVVRVSSSISRETLRPVYRSSTRYQYIGRPRQPAYTRYSIPFVYRKVEGLKAKCELMMRYHDRLLVLTNTGIYEVVQKKARLILEAEGAHFIHQSQQHSNRFYVGTDQGLIFMKYEDSLWQVSEKLKDVVNFKIFSLAGNESILWLGGENQVFRIELNDEGKPERAKKYDFVHSYSEKVVVRMIDDQATFFLSSGIYRYHQAQDSLYRDTSLQAFFNPRSRILYKQASYTWIRPDTRWENIHNANQSVRLENAFLSLFSDLDDIYVDPQQNIWIITETALYRVDAQARLYPNDDFRILIRAVRDSQGHLLRQAALKLDYKNSAFSIDLAAPFYLGESETTFRYKIKGLHPHWSPWSKQSSLSFPYLPSGHYILQIQAKNIFGQESQVLNYRVTVNPPYWETWWFYLAAIVLALLLVIALLKIRTNALRAANRRLELKVKQKTAEIARQKEQLEITFTEIARKTRT
ncbi:MAG: hypothetical protein HC880_18310, partial [Bacteroidia bacterium]|nr:hypothetical protein [Bacteroidia bacterium]